VRLLIADASSVYKKMFIQAAGEVDKSVDITYAATWDEASDKIELKYYDTIVVDIELPGGEGVIALLEKVAWKMPEALVLLTSRPSLRNSQVCAGLVAKGAFDSLTKPIDNSYTENIEFIKAKLTEMFQIVRMKRKKRAANKAGMEIEPRSSRKANNRRGFRPEIVLIAASTGGPQALETVLAGFKSDFPVPVLIVQHMPMSFTKVLEYNLGKKTGLTVMTAEDRDVVEAGKIYLAPGGFHMKLDANKKVCLDDSAPINGIRPAADVLFESVADVLAGKKVLVIILTGMGSDGNKGLARLKEKCECFCLAQSEETCVVYGMPGAVVESGFADKVIDLEQIPFEIENLLRS
jgi:two-component system chemotaxis response regulator CheB